MQLGGSGHGAERQHEDHRYDHSEIPLHRGQREGPEEQVLDCVSDEALEIVYLEEKKKRSAKLEGRAN